MNPQWLPFGFKKLEDCRVVVCDYEKPCGGLYSECSECDRVNEYRWARLGGGRAMIDSRKMRNSD